MANDMTEQKIRQYIIMLYAKGNEACEWKKIENIIKYFYGFKKDDVISCLGSGQHVRWTFAGRRGGQEVGNYGHEN